MKEAKAWRQSLEDRGQKLVVTNGCFDLLHRGHVEYLYSARRYGDSLLVGLNSDSSIRELKGPSRPLMVEADRSVLLASLEPVDAVVIFQTLRATELLDAIRPDIYVKGGDYDINTLDSEEYKVLVDIGCNIELVKFVDGQSTTGYIKRIKELH